MRLRTIGVVALLCVLLGARPAHALLGLGSASPNQGTTAGGTVVDITTLDAVVGTILGVEFGGVPATNVQLVGLLRIRATAPAHAAGAVPITLRLRVIVLGVPVDQIFTLTNGYTYVAPPALTSVAPAFGNVGGGTAVTLSGANFRTGGPDAATPGGMTVRFGGVAATDVVIVNATTITAVTPAHAAGPVAVTVTNGENETATLAAGYVYQAALSSPTISGVTPSSGLQSGGTSIAIQGSGFAPGAVVTVGGLPATSVTVGAGGTTVTATTPAGTPGSQTVAVVNPDTGSATLPGGFTYVALPTLGSVLPGVGPVSGNTPITLAGTAFQAGATVSVCGAQAVVTSVTPLAIAAITPPCAAGAASVSVTNPDGGSVTANGLFTFQASSLPTILAVAPTSGPTTGGTRISITGTQFQAGATVTVGCGAATDVTVSSPLTMLATSPACPAGLANITVTNPDGGTVTLGGGFAFNNVVSTPTLTSVTPATGPDSGGTAIVLSGSNFVLGAVVRVGGVIAPSLVVSSSVLSAVTPPGTAGPASVSVTNPDTGASSLPAGFTYTDSPAILTILPSSGPTSGGVVTTITGSGFQAGVSVTVCGLPAVVLDVLSTAIVTITPPCVAGNAAVVVTNPDGGTVTGQIAIVASSAPTIDAVSPSSGPAAGGTTVTIAGGDFRAGATVTIGCGAATGVVVSATTITADTPACPAGAADVTVTNTDGGTVTLGGGFVFAAAGPPAPTLTSISPSGGPASGGTAVILTGGGFAAGAAVTIGGAPATSVVVASTTTITAVSPAGIAGPADVIVTNADSGTVTLAGGFVYSATPTVTSVTPSGGPQSGGTPITIAGGGFAPGVSAQLCGGPLLLTTVSPTVLAATTPACAAGPSTLVLINPDGGTITVPNAFTFAASSSPTIDSVAPSNGPAAGGTPVTITGADFQSGASVTIGCGAASNVVITATSITAETPACAAGAGDVVVANPDGGIATLGGGFVFLGGGASAPTLTSIAPSSGPASGGTAVTIGGTDFAHGAAVTIGGAPATDVVVVNTTTITATTPAGIPGAADVVVTNADTGTVTALGGFSYHPVPAVTVVAPAAGPQSGGTPITITGTGFAPGVTAQLCGVPLLVTAVSPTALEATTPACAAGPSTLVVTNLDGGTTAVPAAFSFAASSTPTMTAVAPTSGPTAGGTVVTITGSAFQAGATVTIGCGPATAVTVTPTAITATSPACGAGPADVTVGNPDGGTVTLGGSFVFAASAAPVPTLVSIVPSSGPASGGTAITLSGTGFAHGVAVTIGGVAATDVTVVNTTTLTATTPAGTAGPADVVVTNADSGTVTLAAGFTFTAVPSVTSVTPSTGPQSGGTSITIAGSGFAPGVTVRLCDGALVLTTVSPTALSANVPACAAGPATLVVTNPDGGTITLPNAFVYTASSTPAITFVTPTSGPTTGGTALTIGGLGFASGAVVTIGCAAATNAVVTATEITATSPACPAGAANVTVTNPDGGTDTLGGGFAFVVGGVSAPTLTSVTPASGPMAGGTAVAIVGTNFGAGAAVVVGGVPASDVIVVSTTLITATTPPHAAGDVAVVVTNADTGSATLPAGFSYVAPPAPPSLTGITPSFGPTAGSTAFALSGTGFLPGMIVTIGGALVVDLQVPSSTIATGRTPAHAAGTVDVVVTSSGGTAVLPAIFTYQDGAVGTPGDADGDGLPDDCETQFGLDPASGAGPDGALGDPDGDGVTNADECAGGTHPRGFFRRYLAEGATGSFFDTTLAFLNAGPAAARTLVRFQTETGTTPAVFLTIPARTRRTIEAETVAGLAAASFSTLVESDEQVVVERAMAWDATHYGSSAETAVAAPSTTWYFAEGATHGQFTLFYLFQNPGDTAATVEVTYLRLAPKTPVVRTYTVPPRRRLTVAVDGEGPELVAEDLAARIQSSVPIVAERVMYMNSNGVALNAGHAVMGVTAPQPRWFFAEGASGSFFNTFLLVANPNPVPVTIRNTYFLLTGASFSRDYTIGANARLTIGAHADDPRLADTAFSTRVETVGGEGVVAERAMWWPASGWAEGHASMGLDAPGIEWAVAGGRVGGPENAETYVLVANENATAAAIVVRALREDGSVIERPFAVAPRSRFNVTMSAMFPALADSAFGVVVESVGATPVPVTVESSVYGSPAGQVWASGANARGTRLR